MITTTSASNKLQFTQSKLVSNQEPASLSSSLSFGWTGDTVTYVKLHITNLLLSIVTLGIYSSWAKVRTKRYFYGNTSLLDSSFDFDASPSLIFTARLTILFIIFFLGFLWGLFTNLHVNNLSLLLLLFIPYLIVRSHAFNAHHSMWRNVRFKFEKKQLPSDFHFVFMTLPLVVLFLLFINTERLKDYEVFHTVILSLTIYGLLTFPINRWWIHRIRINQLSFGNLKFKFQIKLSQYIKIYIIHALPLVIVGILTENGSSIAVSLIFGVFLLYLILLSLFAHFKHLFWNGIHTNENSKIKADFKPFEYAIKIMFLNHLIVIFTLGVLFPVAKVRNWRYIANNLSFHPSKTLGVVLQDSSETENVLAAESVEGFDFDIE